MTSLTAEETELVEWCNSLGQREGKLVLDLERLLSIISRLDLELDRHKRALSKCKEQRDSWAMPHVFPESAHDICVVLRSENQEIQNILEGAGDETKHDD